MAVGNPFNYRREARNSPICFSPTIYYYSQKLLSLNSRWLRKKCLDDFCGASGQRVSLAKSKLFVSTNVRGPLERELSRLSGIPSTRNLGTYLGMPVFHTRVVKDDFAPILAKVQARLAGWKSRSLSMAGRVTLVKSVLSSIPIYVMQTVLLPTTICERLDKLCRDFVWGSTKDHRRIHLVSWTDLCAPKAKGGLGIRNARSANLTVLSKLSWRMFTQPEQLWASVMIHKYRLGLFQWNKKISDVTRFV